MLIPNGLALIADGNRRNIMDIHIKLVKGKSQEPQLKRKQDIQYLKEWDHRIMESLLRTIGKKYIGVHSVEKSLQ